MGSQELSKNYDKDFFKNLSLRKRLRSRFLCAIEITSSQSNCLQVMRSDFGNCTTKKLLSRFCYISRSTRQLYCMDFSLAELERICSMFLYGQAGRKNHINDLVTYPEVLSSCIACTSAWVNQKGYVTCSFATELAFFPLKGAHSSASSWSHDI